MQIRTKATDKRK